MIHYGDICALRGSGMEPVDCVIGGSPCQGLSYAGRRLGLEDGRSVLFLEQVRIVRELREEDVKRGRTGINVRPRFMVWENVPGALSTGKPKGEDFRRVLEEIARIADPAAVIPGPPGGAWRTAGAIVGNGWSIAWRITDAQYFGVPQRRRRITLIADFGGESASEILFERAGVPGNPAPGREARQEAAGHSATGAGVADRLGGRGEANGGVVWPETAGSLICRQDGSPCVDRGAQIVVQSAGFNGHRAAGAEIEFAEERAPGVTASMPPNVVAYSGTQITSPQNRSNPKPGDPCPALCAEAQAPIVVAGFKAGQGADAGSVGFQEECAPTIGGTASGLNQVPTICIQGNCIDRADTAGCNGRGWRDDDRSYILNTIDRPAVLCMATGQANAEVLREQSPTLNCDHEQPICYDTRGNGDGRIVPTITGDHGNRVTDYTALAIDCRNHCTSGISGTLQAKGTEGGQSLNCINPVLCGIVRRLTPLECERLQGYPDGWTLLPEITDISDYAYEVFCGLLFDAAVRSGTARLNVETGVHEVWSKKRYAVRRGGEIQYTATVWKNTGKAYQHKTKPQMVRYIDSLCSDSSRYKALGNSIALPPWRWVLGRVCAQYDRPATLGSLFDGIGGFPLIWEGINGKGSCRWTSEIEPFCVAVTMVRFEEEAIAA